MEINIPVSAGELLDKITILIIKSINLRDKSSLSNVYRELLELLNVSYAHNIKLDQDFIDLLIINSKLWDIEDNIRTKEKSCEFDEDFIELARNVYYSNDQRFSIKNSINKKYNSNIKEEKSYK